MSVVSGTFTGTGASAAITASIFTIQMNFTGTASVDIQSQMPDGSWITVDSKTADYTGVVEQGGNVPYRLNCTAYTNNVDYALTSK